MAELTANQVLISRGSWVEVSLDHPRFSKSWYKATVLRLCTQKIQVKLQNLSDPDTNGPLIRFVDLERVRPIPPPDHPGVRFFEGMKVNVKEDGGWWEALILTVHDSIEKFTVFMESNWTIRQFSGSELRMHWVWDNNWVLPTQHQE
ncbi:DUF724 domain-containing protein 6-like [Apium graveolens]|uniref:DUF724 domain-containing protein 6-like n=1 Tax=Apium graveolens TaxID=4045 RepID=UPI003D7AFDFF